MSAFVGAMVEEFRECGEPLSAPEWELAAHHVGLACATDLTSECIACVAELTSDLYSLGLLAGPALAYAVPTAWTLTDAPLWGLGHRRWREMFTAVGFTVDGAPAPRPDGPVLLYRGATHDRRRGWSWTPHLAVARRFATEHGRAGNVYRAEVPPAAMLAAISSEQGAFFGESEVVVDTARLTIQRHERGPVVS